MFKSIVSGFKQVIGRKELIIAVIALFIGVALLSYSGSKSFSLDGMDGGHVSDLAKPHVAPVPSSVPDSLPIPPAAGYNMSPVNNASDLLPNDPNSEWAQLNPGLNAGATPDLLAPGKLIGISSSPMRNSNLQYRSDPVIPTQDIGPWNHSTIDRDISRVPLEVGYGSF
jgi:hypothetical protein